MSQTTRCPACETMFKVVADQLKIAQGWVRCGQCGEIFDASGPLLSDQTAASAELTSAPVSLASNETKQPDAEDLKPLRQPAAIDTMVETAAADDLAVDHPASARSPAEDDIINIEPSFDAKSHHPLPEDAAAEQVAVEPASIEPAALDLPEPAAADATLAASEIAAAQAPGAPLLRLKTPAFEAPALETPAPVAAAGEVSFVRDAQRQALWKNPRMRALMGLLALLLLAALALQWTVQQKDSLAVLHPRLVPLLEALCAPLGCEIRPLRRIGSLLIDSSTFSKTGTDTYRLGFVLKNNGATALEIPAVEVALTDSQDRTLVRRVITPGQFGAAGGTLGAHLEFSGAVILKVAAPAASGASQTPAASVPAPVAGYRIVAFYP